MVVGSYMQQMAEVEAMVKQIGDAFNAGKPEEGKKLLLEQQLKKENAIVGEMIRLYGDNLSADIKNFARNIDPSFNIGQRQDELSRLVIKERNRLGEPPVKAPGVTPPPGNPPGVPPVVNGSYMQQMAEVEAMSKEIGDLFRAGKPDEGQKKWMEQQIKKENAIVGVMIRL